MQSEGKAIPPPQEGESAPNIIQELDILFPSEPSKTSFSDLASLVERSTSDT